MKKKNSTGVKEEIRELKSDLFWYNVLLGVSLVSTGLRVIWVLTKYKQMTADELVWKLAIIVATALSLSIYYWIRRRSIVRKLKKGG